MKNDLHAVIVIGLLVITCVGKQKPESAPAREGSGEKKEENSAEEIPLVNFRGDKIRFTIKIPEGSKELQNDAYGWSTTWIFPDGMNEINVNVTQAVSEIKSLEDAAKYTSLGGGQVGAKIQKRVGADYLIIKEPLGIVLQEFWYFAKASDGFVLVKCTAPPSHETICIKIVGSLKAL